MWDGNLELEEEHQTRKGGGMVARGGEKQRSEGGPLPPFHDLELNHTVE